jgi:hypothetical protein
MVPVPLFRLGPSRDEVIEGWPWLDQVVLDGALISDLDLELAEGVNRQELELMPLGEPASDGLRVPGLYQRLDWFRSPKLSWLPEPPHCLRTVLTQWVSGDASGSQLLSPCRHGGQQP